MLSLLLQSKSPDKINLWVSANPYLRDMGIRSPALVDDFLASLPDALAKLVHVRWVSNTGPYRKLIPVLREATLDDLIVTADDDIFYGENWLKILLDAYYLSQDVAVAARVRGIEFNFLGRETSYIYWRLLKKPIILSNDYVVTFGGGAVLSKAMFREEDIADNAFLEIAPTADDLWYSKLLMRNSIKVCVVPDVLNELNFIIHNDGLINDNYSKKLSLFSKIPIRLWSYLAGYFGMTVSGNDCAYKKINRYFYTIDNKLGR